MVTVTILDERVTSMVSTESARYWGNGLQPVSQVRRQAQRLRVRRRRCCCGDRPLGLGHVGLSRGAVGWRLRAGRSATRAALRGDQGLRVPRLPSADLTGHRPLRRRARRTTEPRGPRPIDRVPDWPAMPLQLGRRQLFDVDVLERQDPNLGDESGLSIHVPYPCVAQLHFDHRLGGVSADVQLDVVGQIEPALGLHGVAEHGRDVLVLLSELELTLGLEVLEIVGAQRGCSITPRGSARSGVALFPDLGGLADAVTEVVQLGATNVATLDDLQLDNRRGVDGKRALDADPVADLADRVGLGDTAALPGDDVALEDLNTLLVALDHLDVDLDLVAAGKVGDISAEVLVVNKIGGLHGADSRIVWLDRLRWL